MNHKKFILKVGLILVFSGISTGLCASLIVSAFLKEKKSETSTIIIKEIPIVMPTITWPNIISSAEKPWLPMVSQTKWQNQLSQSNVSNMVSVSDGIVVMKFLEDNKEKINGWNIFLILSLWISIVFFSKATKVLANSIIK